MRDKFLLLSLVVLGAGAAGCGSSSGLCSGISGNCVSFEEGVDEADIQSAFATAPADTTFVFGEGTFSFTNELDVVQPGIAIIGAGMDQTIFDFSGQTSGGQGMLITAGPFLISDLTVNDTPGDGIKGFGAAGAVDGFTAARVHVAWTTTPNTTHGPYGLYPVQCNDVLLENNLVEGASDSGIYVGQSTNIVVRNNTVQKNVAGIEIENSSAAEVYGNTAQDNTGGILVFALPGLQVEDCHDILVHDNMMLHNNTANFAAQGDIVSIVPSGTGSFITAAKHVEFKTNQFADNNTANFAIIAYVDAGLPINDANYNPFPSSIWIHDNTFSGGGTMPDITGGMDSIGFALAVSEAYFPGGNKIPDMVYDGTIDTSVVATIPGNPMNICFMNNLGASVDATFTDLNFPTLDPNAGFVNASSDITAFTCTLPAVSPVTFPGV